MPDMIDMGPQDRIIALYEAMAAITAAMLAAARAEDWDVLVTLEATCAARVASLQQGEPLATLSLQQNERKAALLKQMLANDIDIRQLAATRMTQLSNEMSSASTERKLSKAYDA